MTPKSSEEKIDLSPEEPSPQELGVQLHIPGLTSIDKYFVDYGLSMKSEVKKEKVNGHDYDEVEDNNSETHNNVFVSKNIDMPEGAVISDEDADILHEDDPHKALGIINLDDLVKESKPVYISKEQDAIPAILFGERPKKVKKHKKEKKKDKKKSSNGDVDIKSVKEGNNNAGIDNLDFWLGGGNVNSNGVVSEDLLINKSIESKPNKKNEDPDVISKKAQKEVPNPSLFLPPNPNLLTQNEDIKLSYEFRQIVQMDSNKIAVQMIITNVGEDQLSDKLEFDIVDSPHTRLLGKEDEQALSNDETLSRTVRGSVTYRKGKCLDFKINIPSSAFMMPCEGFEDALAAGLLIFQLSKIIEEIENSAYLFAKSIWNHRVAFLLKLDKGTKAFTVEGKSTDMNLLTCLMEEIK
ncbi:AP3D [Lepeophtheirus salmonis]|uniref:AP3D n=1 Tax=Lepeophtheirus salmonis TaxID=72036 RepID=A0A7R8CLF4_LEPSM|nr:AP3D [Lepeophtheirus salmonis]CAF2858412.1 AP3D [Lepeophtheirus salmonis]